MSTSTPTRKRRTPTKAVSLRKLAMEKSIWKKKQDGKFGVWYLENQLTGDIKPLSGYSTETTRNSRFSPMEKDTAMAASPECARPRDTTATADDDSLHWYENWSDEHLCMYYYNPYTQESLWTVPANAIVHRMDSPSKVLVEKSSSAVENQTQQTKTQHSSRNKAADAGSKLQDDRCFRKLRFGGLCMMGSKVPAECAKAGENSCVDTNRKTVDETGTQSTKADCRGKVGFRKFGNSIGLNTGLRAGISIKSRSAGISGHQSRFSRFSGRGGLF